MYVSSGRWVNWEWGGGETTAGAGGEEGRGEDGMWECGWGVGGRVGDRERERGVFEGGV